MGQLGVMVATGVLSTQNLMIPGTPLWVVSFTVDMMPRDQDFEIYHGFALGPGGFAFTYLENMNYGSIENGLFSEYNPRSSAWYVRKGQSISIVWSIGTGNPPVVRLWMRTPEVGRI